MDAVLLPQATQEHFASCFLMLSLLLNFFFQLIGALPGFNF